MSRLALQLTCYNGARYLPFLFASLKKQTFAEWELYVLDNGSNAEEAVAITHAVNQSGLPVHFSRVEDTLNFAAGHNFLFTKHDATFVQLLNDDAILDSQYLNEVVAYLEAHPRCASASGRIFRWQFENAETARGGRTDTVDSLGLERLMTGMVRERFRGVALSRISERALRQEHVFGVSGCLPMYRRSAVLETSPDKTLFDPTFVSYKEDVEIAYRFQSAGFISAIVHKATAYHRRTFSRGAHATQSYAVQKQSYRNHWWILLMHWSWKMFLLRSIAVISFELAKIGYWLFRRPMVLIDGWKETVHEWGNLLRKRRFFMQLAATRHHRRFIPLVHPPAGFTFAVVMVSHNDLNEVCLLSLQKAIEATAHKVQVVVVDNASKNYHANQFVDQYIPNNAITVLRNGDFGFGSSCNRGAIETDAQYLLFLNPDTLISDEHFFDNLKTFLDANPQAGIVAPRVHHFNGELQETCRRFPLWFMPFVQRTGLGNTNFGQRYAHRFLMRDYDHLKTRMVDWVQGSAMCIAKPLFDELGGFDDHFWMYFEDIDLCRRVWETGHPVYYFPQTHIRHAYGKASASRKNFLLNLLTNVMAHAHIVSWLKYQWKWRNEKNV
ncbi:MAG: glycosyltransferase [Patescibacteria group bacterium]